MNLRKKHTVLQTALIVLACFTLFSGSIVYGEDQTGNGGITAEGWQRFVDTQFSQAIKDLIAYRDTLNIPKDEVFRNEGMSYEDFQNMPRRDLTDNEIAGLKTAVEHRKKVIEHGPSLGDTFGQPSGTNNFNYDLGLWGDVLLVHDGNVAWGYSRHAGMFDKVHYDSGQDPIIEADPIYGVHYAPRRKFWGYDKQIGLKPHPGDGYRAYNAWLNALTHIGKPYNWNFANKLDTAAFYCSSLVWRCYYDAGWDIDLNGGSVVLPDELYNLSYFAVWQRAD